MTFRPPFIVAMISFMLMSCTTSVQTDRIADTNPTLENVPYSSIVSLSHKEPDATIYYAENDLQFGKLWLPNSSIIEPHYDSPLVIFIHGGCWLNAYSIDHSFPLTSALAENGAMVWSLEYRRTGDTGGGWPGTFTDILLGIQYFLQQTNYKYDKSKVFLVGHSAGGHLALLAEKEIAVQNQNDVVISKVIGLAAISNLAKYATGKNSCQAAVSQFMDGNIEAQQLNYQQADPALQLIKHHSATKRFLLHGTADSIVPLHQSTEAQFQATIIEVQNGGHFDWLHPQSESFQVLLDLIKDSGE